MVSPLVFLSYSHSDTEFANRLSDDLQALGLSVWQDWKNVRPGDSISTRIENALHTSDYFLLVLSTASISSAWVDREYRTALNLQLEKGKPYVIPLRLHALSPPMLLRDIQYVDFAVDYTVGWAELTRLFEPADFRALRVGGGSGTGIYLLRRIIAIFRETHPDLPIQERIDVSEEIIKAGAAANVEFCLDAAIVGTIPGDDLRQAVEWQEVFRDRSVLTVPSGHPLWGKESISEGEMLSLVTQDATLISRPKQSGQYKEMWKYLEPRLGRMETELLLGRFVAYDLEAAKTFVSQGRGISIMPHVILKNIYRRAECGRSRLPGNACRSWYGVWPKKRQRSSIAEEFTKLLKQTLRTVEEE